MHHLPRFLGVSHRAGNDNINKNNSNNNNNNNNNNFSEEISWQELQRALTPNVLSKLLQKRQAAEVATAGYT